MNQFSRTQATVQLLLQATPAAVAVLVSEAQILTVSGSSPKPESTNATLVWIAQVAEHGKQLAVQQDDQGRIDDALRLQARLQFVHQSLTEGQRAALINATSDELGELLDKQKGSQVTDQKIFDAHARKYEAEFLEDMRTLGVKDPDVLTRVTEYVPKIVEFIQKIVTDGLAYESGGSVYLSIDRYREAGYTYRKLKPGKETSEVAMEESEGALGGDTEKQSKNDFVLWKASKPGEPFWASPWGQGRPGWHIECSVVASDILGPNMDIHAGGKLLRMYKSNSRVPECFLAKLFLTDLVAVCG